MGAKQSKQKLSRDQMQLNNFYMPNMSDNKLEYLETKVKKNKYKYMGRSFVFGFVLEYFLGVGKIYDNINRKSAIRRLGMFLSI